MKKLTKVFLLLALCILGLCACGNEVKDYSGYQIVAANSFGLLSDMAGTNKDDITAESKEQFLSAMTDRDWAKMAEIGNDYQVYMNGFVFEDAVTAWWNAMDELECLVVLNDDYKSWKVTEANGDVTVSIPLQGISRSATMEVTMKDDYTIDGIVVNPDYTFGEKMLKAALNTLLGMGTVFIVLIFIIVIISCFGIIYKIQNRKENKAKESVSASDKVVAQIEKREEEDLSSDLELVAVITAAITAYEGSASSDGFVVRSIKRVKR